MISDNKRRIIRRQGDKNKQFFVDQYSPKLFLPIIIILFLSVSDALLTLFLISQGAYETNPIMAYYLDLGPYIFFAVKFALTSFGIIVLLTSKNFIYRVVRVSISSLLYLFVGIFFAVVTWEMLLVSMIIV